MPPPYLAASSSPWASPAAPRHPLEPPRTLPRPQLLLCSLSLSARAELVATDAVRRGRSHRPASPTLRKAPPHLPLHPHPDERRRKPLDAASSTVPLLGHRGSPSSNSSPFGLPRARRPPLRDPRELHSVSPPSFCSFPCRSTPAHIPEHRRPPWPRSSPDLSPSARTRGTSVLLVARGCHLDHQLLP